MFDRNLGRARRRLTTIAAAIAVVLAVPVAVIAAHSFDDVPDSNQFHDAIAWMQENGITIGCNPPANTQYCPEDNVSRQQMAAFMFRLAQTEGSAGIGVTDPADTVTVDQRRAIFRAVVEAQDAGMSVETSRAEAARRFDVTETQVKAIEREGLEKEWPPL